MFSKHSPIFIAGIVFVQLIFLIFKLSDTVGWSWWWVTSPLWVIIAIVSWYTYRHLHRGHN